MNGEQVQEKLEQRPYRCYHCGEVLGIRTEKALIIGAARFLRSVTLQCGYCRRTTFFKPESEPVPTRLDKQASR